MSSGISLTGFKRKRLDEIKSDLESLFKSVYGSNLNVSPESPDGQIIGLLSGSFSDLWEIAEGAYNAFNPSAASGVTLSNLVQLNGITRNAATFSRAQLDITGTPGTIIPSGSLVSNQNTNEQFSTEIEITLNEAGNGVVFASAIESGPIIALAGTLTEIDTPISGWDSAINNSDAEIGADEESDAELRARRARSVSTNSQSIIDSIFSGISDIDGVTQVAVLENDTDVTDINGLPPHSFEAIVVGGVDEDIGNVIWLKKPAGILSFGNTTVVILDSQNISHNISFTRPTLIPIYVEVDITTSAEYPVDGDSLIKQAIVDYANGDLIDGRGFFLAEDVIYSRLYTPINSVQGHEIAGLRIGTSPSPVGTSNISIASSEVSQFLIANIVVNS